MTRALVALVLVLCGVSAGAAADDDNRRQQQSAPETEQDLERQIEALQSTGPLKAAHDIWDEVGRMEEAIQPKREEAEQRANKLMESPEYKEAAKKLDELYKRREKRFDAERQAMAEAARKLYGDRHAELRALTAAELKEGKALGFNVLTYPRVDGSTSTQPMLLIVASRLLGAPYEWTYPEPTGYPWARNRKHLDRRFEGAALRQPDDEFNIAGAYARARTDGSDAAQHRLATMINGLLAAPSNTHDAMVNLIEGKTDLVVNVRGPSPGEQKLADEKGVKLELTPVAKDAVVFIVNVKNPVKTLSQVEIRNLYSNRYPSWDKLGVAAIDGDKNKRLTAYVREPDSGSRELFDTLAMQGRPPKETDPPRRELISYSMMGPYNQVTTDEGGIGYSVYYYEHFMSASPYTRPVAIDGVEPTSETIASGKYPYVTPIYAIRRAGEPADSAASKLLKWLLSDDGQAVVRESGYVPAK